ncbi:hypothetical protein QUF88_09615 [Bacillus sp. DX1.1]|uniref:hypothetical protein n=1 Tax=unclassified Bacillus (in: firmicutes) TaxID=185979 RepID=UPI002570B9CA|nr:MULTISPECIES: hypothetical protein [unclassified Bacillus (in: firmicutes)]MDM5154080.1 hypothetical protein [Bacillus sp. DX1.1]WJE84018.1 hypothetical protein QRE67_07120 [Bacillus sp. DX3.1]
MKVLSSIRFWQALMSCVILCSALFLVGEYSTSKAAGTLDAPPYELLYAKQNTIPLSSPSQKEKVVVKGMVITKTSSYNELNQIAKKLKEQYAKKKIDAVELSIHNKNNGQYEEELPYEPISKGTISITYHSPSSSHVIVRLSNRL